jgi:hypothetical protein
MLRCALDVRPQEMRLALFGFWPQEPTVLLEAARLRSRRPQRVLELLEQWSLFYANAGDDRPILVGCRADGWPSTLAPSLEAAGYRLHWIDDAPAVAHSEAFLQSLQQGRRFMRVSIMAHWRTEGRGEYFEGPAFQVQYDLLRQRLLDLEMELCIEGRLPCPGHLLEYCPNCDTEAAYRARQESAKCGCCCDAALGG